MGISLFARHGAIRGDRLLSAPHSFEFLKLYPKVAPVAKEGSRTLWREWPEPRSTNDLDLFLRPELLIESVKLKPMGEIFLPHPYTFSMMKLFALPSPYGSLITGLPGALGESP